MFQRWSSIFVALFSWLLFSTQVALSQDGGVIEGRVMEKDKPLDLATVLLYTRADTTKALKSAITDSTGKFFLSDIMTGSYLLKIHMTSYETLRRNIIIDSLQLHYDAGDLSLNASVKQLQSVTIISQVNPVQRTPQGIIVNAASNLTQAGGTLTDLLRNTPTVVVDDDGNITIRGKAPLILVNGRNSAIAGTDQIAASSVESIEIINNPSALHDAEAEGGIINIKLKKNNRNGTNGALALGAGYGEKGRINSSAYLNHKAGKWNYAMTYDNRFAGRTRSVNGDRINYASEEERYLTQRRSDERVDKLQNLRLNLDFTPDKYNTWGLEAIGNLIGEDNDETLVNTTHSSNGDFYNKYSRHSREIRKAKLGEVAFTYGRKYQDPERSLTASASTAFSDDRENTDITSQSLTEEANAIGDPFLQKTHNYQNTNVTNLKTDYVYPVSARSVIETGYKATLRFMNADFQALDNINGDYVVNTSASNIFKFDEQIHSVYLQYASRDNTKDVSKWKYDIGLRAEQDWNNGESKDDSSQFSNSYLQLFPSANLVYYHQPKAYWKFSYSRRINRPGFGQLNPFTDITDSLNQRSGNPNLDAELVHSLELGYNEDWEKINLLANLFYRYTSDAIRPYTVLRDDGVAYTQPMNFGHAITYGMEAIVSARPWKKYDFNFSISLFQQEFEGTEVTKEISNEAFSWYGKWINNLALWKGSKLQVTGVYNAPLPTPQGERIAIYYADLGFQQKFGKGNARLGLTITDIFNTQKNGFTTNGESFTFTRVSKVDSRAIVVMFAYTFGTSFKEKLLENQYSND